MKRTPLGAIPAACLAVASAFCAPVALAADDLQYRLSGFGTLGGAKTDTDGAGFRTSVSHKRGADKDFDLGVDSRAAVQGTVTYKEDFSVTAQLLGIRREESDFDIGFEWLYAQYTGVKGLDLKAGRVVLPAFLVSDSRLVGYSVPWVRVPPLVYAMMPMSNVDGGQATYRHSVGSAVLSGQVTLGRTDTTSYTTTRIPLGPTALYLTGKSDSESRNIVAANAMLEWGDWTARVSQITSDVNLNVAYQIPGFGTSRTAIKFEDTFQGAGLQYDDGSMLVVSEYVRRKTDPAVQNAYSWYIAAGYRFGTVMPYAMVSQYKVTKSTQAALEPKTKGVAAGVRYDFAKNLALKGEWARYKNHNSYIFADAASPAVKGKDVDVMSVVLDFVF